MTIQIDPEDTETEILHSLVDFTGKNVLEVGCGDGRLTWRYADKAQKITAIDPDSEEIAVALKNRPKELDNSVEFIESTLLDFKLSDEMSRFDVVILSWSLCCMDPEEMVPGLEKTYDMLKIDGLLINIQPYGEREYLEIHRENKLWRAGKTRDKTNYADEKQARASLEKVIENDLYIVQRECRIPFLTHHDKMSDFEKYISENWQHTTLDDKTIRQARKLEKRVGVESEVVIREKLFIASLRPNANHIPH